MPVSKMNELNTKISSDILTAYNSTVGTSYETSNSPISVNGKYVSPKNFPAGKFLVIGSYLGAADSPTGASIYVLAIGADDNVTLLAMVQNGDTYPVYGLTVSNILYVKRSGGTGECGVRTRLIPLG